MNICLDAGHGGMDGGAIGPNSFTEAWATMKICLHIRRGLIELNHEVFCTRSEDKFVTLDDRVEIAKTNQADLFLSIHCNAFSNPAAHGHETWTSAGETRADPIAERIFNSICESFPKLAPRYDKTDGDSDKEAGFKVLRGCEEAGIPAVLVETAFISNPIEERWLRDPGWRMRMAGAVVSGVGR